MTGIPRDPTGLSAESRAERTRLVDTRPAVPDPRPSRAGAEADGDVPVSTTRPLPVAEPEVLLRFGPGVPARGTVPRAAAEQPQPTASRRWWRVLNVALTGVLALVVLWLIWPSPPVEVREVAVRAPAVVGCENSADVVATLRTDGRAGTIRYRWVRNDGVTSAVLDTTAVRGKRSTDVHLRWTFTGPGTYSARATIEVIQDGMPPATVAFDYRC